MTNSYNPTKWVEYKTVATANVMNNIEKGIVDAHEKLCEVDSQIKDFATIPMRFDDEIDDTQSLIRAVEKGKTIKLKGTYYISDSIEVANIKIIGDNRDTKIIMTSNNKPIFIVSGGGFTLNDCTLQYQNFQDITNINSIAITPKENKMVDLCNIDRVNFINCYSAIKSDWTDNNKVFYSCNFSNLNISNYSHSAIYMKGGTGCYLNNIYTHNWLDYSLKTLRESKYIILIQDYSEFSFNQLNFEWCKPKNPILILNSMENCIGTSLHIEGIDFTNTLNIFSFISSNVNLKGLNIMNNDLSKCSNLNMFSVSGECYIDIDLLVERDNEFTSLSTNLFNGINTHDNLYIKVGKCKLSKFSKNSYFPRNQYNLMPIKEIDGVKYEGNENGQKVLYLSALPTTNRYLKNTKIYNTNCESGGYIGWVCVAGGYFDGYTTNITTTTTQAYVNVIDVSEIGELKVGDLIGLSGSSREYVITKISGTTITLSQNIEVQLTNSIVSIKEPKFKGFGLIEN